MPFKYSERGNVEDNNSQLLQQGNIRHWSDDECLMERQFQFPWFNTLCEILLVQLNCPKAQTRSVFFSNAFLRTNVERSHSGGITVFALKRIGCWCDIYGPLDSFPLLDDISQPEAHDYSQVIDDFATCYVPVFLMKFFFNTAQGFLPKRFSWGMRVRTWTVHIISSWCPNRTISRTKVLEIELRQQKQHLVQWNSLSPTFFPFIKGTARHNN